MLTASKRGDDTSLLLLLSLSGDHQQSTFVFIHSSVQTANAQKNREIIFQILLFRSNRHFRSAENAPRMASNNQRGRAELLLTPPASNSQRFFVFRHILYSPATCDDENKQSTDGTFVVGPPGRAPFLSAFFPLPQNTWPRDYAADLRDRRRVYSSCKSQS